MQGGECVLCYYSSSLQCIIGISEPFKVSNKHTLYTKSDPLIDIYFPICPIGQLETDRICQYSGVPGPVSKHHCDLLSLLGPRVQSSH